MAGLWRNDVHLVRVTLKGSGILAQQPTTVLPYLASRWRFGLRALLATAFGVLAFLAAALTALALGSQADRRLRGDISAEFTTAAERVADLLDRSLFERLRDIQILASLPALRSPTTPETARRRVLREMQEAFPQYAILFFLSPEGEVLITSNGLLEGSSFAERDIFLEGRRRPYIGDLGEPTQVLPLLTVDPNTPSRFIDLAAPVLGPDGRLTGVVAAHLFWDWARHIRRDALAPLRARHPGVQSMILNHQGEVLLGPPGLERAMLSELAPGAEEALQAGRSGSLLVARGAEGHLIGFAPTRGHQDVPGLRWSVLIRGDAAAAFAPLSQLRASILGWSVSAALVAAMLGWLLAGLLARPLEVLSQVALRLRENPHERLPRQTRLREADDLSASFSTLLESLRRREQELAEGEAQLRTVLEQMPVGVVLAEMPGGRLCLSNARATEILGRPVDLAGLATEQDTQGALRSDGVPYEAADIPLARAVRLGEIVVREMMLYRRGDGSQVWLAVSAAPVRSASGQALLAVCTFDDVTEARMAAERQRVLAREVDHRAKNALAVVQAALRLTRADSTEDFVRAVEGRVAALARAQIRLAESEWRGADLRALLEGELSAMLSEEQGGTLRLLGPPITLTVEAAQPLCMVFHELATNAARHGAFSVPGGCVSIDWSVEGGVLRLRWTETDGPALRGPPARRGFGARVVEATLRGQLGGTMHWHWRGTGLCCELQLPLLRVAAEAPAA